MFSSPLMKILVWPKVMQPYHCDATFPTEARAQAKDGSPEHADGGATRRPVETSILIGDTDPVTENHFAALPSREHQDQHDQARKNHAGRNDR